MSEVTRTGAFRAVLQAAGKETEYLRSGRGRPILLLIDTRLEDPFWTTLVDALARTNRVVAPTAAADTTHFWEWVRPFLDGLGLGRIAIVSAESLGPTALGYALLDPNRVSHVVILVSDSIQESDGTSSGTPLLTISRARPIPELVASLERFLAGASAEA